MYDLGGLEWVINCQTEGIRKDHSRRNRRQRIWKIFYDKLQAAVEQGTGNDPSGRYRTGTTWYHEAFDGVTVYVQTTELSVGYMDPPQRSSVLDVKLTQTQDNQSDMFNEQKYNMSQYRARPYSDAYYETDAAGTFKGTEVYMKEMSRLFFRRKFFIPNATVDDIH